MCLVINSPGGIAGAVVVDVDDLRGLTALMDEIQEHLAFVEDAIPQVRKFRFGPGEPGKVVDRRL